MMEFCVYSICVAKSSNSDDPQLKNFLMWNLKRCMDIWEDNKKFGDTSRVAEYWNRFLNNPDANELRLFARDYFGENWTREVLGF